MWSSLFWKDAAERVVATFAQALLAVFIVAPQTSLIAFDWPSALGVAGTAAFISLLKAVVANLTSQKSVSPASLAPDDRGI